MSERMIGIRVSITRYVSDDPQPGIVECELFDANQRRWKFVEKTAVVCLDDLNCQSRYRQPGIIGCTIVKRDVDAEGREILTVDTSQPWSVESVDEQSRFGVSPDSIVEWEWGTNNLKASNQGNTDQR
jgi:hypothetical protein